jgi:hypothetical protein
VTIGVAATVALIAAAIVIRRREGQGRQ